MRLNRCFLNLMPKRCTNLRQNVNLFCTKLHFLIDDHLFLILQGCDAAYLTNIHTEFDSHKDYVKGEDRRNWDKEFGIRHYAGTVTYKVEGFVDKNRDSQQDVFFDYLEKSKKKFVHELVEFKVGLKFTKKENVGESSLLGKI